jgi:hypothetical protein
MEDKSEHDSEQVTNQEPLLFQETSTPTKQISKPLPIGIKPI